MSKEKLTISFTRRPTIKSRNFEQSENLKRIARFMLPKGSIDFLDTTKTNVISSNEFDRVINGYSLNNVKKFIKKTYRSSSEFYQPITAQINEFGVINGDSGSNLKILGYYFEESNFINERKKVQALIEDNVGIQLPWKDDEYRPNLPTMVIDDASGEASEWLSNVTNSMPGFIGHSIVFTGLDLTVENN